MKKGVTRKCYSVDSPSLSEASEANNHVVLLERVHEMVSSYILLNIISLLPSVLATKSSNWGFLFDYMTKLWGTVGFYFARHVFSHVTTVFGSTIIAPSLFLPVNEAR